MIYLFYGDEKYELYKEIENIKKKFDKLEVGVNLFNINKDNISELGSLYNSVSFFGDNKLVIIKDTSLKFDVKKLISESLDTDCYVIVEDTVDKRTSEYKELSKVADVKEFKCLNENEMSMYLINLLKKYKIDMSKDVADYMVSTIGINKTNNINELQKIVIFLGQNSKVTKEVIDKVCSKTLNSKIFDMLDLTMEKKHKEAENMLNDLLMQKEPAIKIAIMLYKQVKQLYLIKLMQKDQRYENDKISSILKIHPYVYSKLLKYVNRYKEEELVKILNLFELYDSKTKIGELDFDIGLKKIICTM